MPKVQLPKNLKGWLVTLVSSMVGFVAGTLALAELSKRLR